MILQCLIGALSYKCCCYLRIVFISTCPFFIFSRRFTSHCSFKNSLLRFLNREIFQGILCVADFQENNLCVESSAACSVCLVQCSKLLPHQHWPDVSVELQLIEMEYIQCYEIQYQQGRFTFIYHFADSRCFLDTSFTTTEIHCYQCVHSYIYIYNIDPELKYAIHSE